MMLDTSALYAWLFEGDDRWPLMAPHLERGDAAVTWSQLGELANRLGRAGRDPQPVIDEVLGWSVLREPRLEDHVAGAQLCIEARRHDASRRFSLADGIILACARRHREPVLTFDRQFESFSDAIVLRPAKHAEIPTGAA